MESSPRWSTNTKLVIMLAFLAVAGFCLIRFQILIMPTIMAVILAYLLNPIVTALTRRLRLSRTLAVLLLYAALILLAVGLIGWAGFLLQQQLYGALATALDFVKNIPDWIDSLTAKPAVVGPFTFDLSSANGALIRDALLPTARDGIGRITGWMTGVASDVAAFFGWAAFAFLVAFYLLHDMDVLEKGLLWIVPQGYHRDVRRLLAELVPIWNAFLRGQILLSLVMGAGIGLIMSILGLRYALILALMAALAEFVPIIGANVIGITAILFALFQPSNRLGLAPIPYALVVMACGGVWQQFEANFLVPRVMGDQLKLHPAVLIIGALVGFSLLGIPGLLLAGPIIATTLLFGRYAQAKIFDLPPWPDREEGDSSGGQAPSPRTRSAQVSGGRIPAATSVATAPKASKPERRRAGSTPSRGAAAKRRG